MIPTLAALLLLARPLAAEDSPQGEEDEPSESSGAEGLADEVLVIEAQRAEISLRRIDEEEVRRRGAPSVAALLEQEPSMHAASGGRGERQLVVRGFEQRQVAVFIDGVPASVPYDGYLDLGKFPATLVESVTYAPGAAAGIYGPDSLGGALRIRTRPPPAQPEGAALVRGAAQGAVEAAAHTGGPLGPLRLRLGGGGRATLGFPLAAGFEPVEREDGGLRDASDSRSQDLHGRVFLDMGRAGELEAGANYLQGAWGVPTGLEDDAPRYWRWSDYRDLGTSLVHRTPSEARVALEEMVWLGANSNVLDAYDDASRTTQEDDSSWHSTYRDRRWGGALTASGQPGPLRIRSWLFGDHQVHRSVADIGEAEERVATTLLSAAASAETDLPGSLQGFLGLEADGELPGQQSDFTPAPFFLGPSTGLQWQPAEVFRLALGAARRARTPTLKERFSESLGYREANTELGPETAWHVGLDLELIPFHGASLAVAGYDAEMQGLIEDVPLGGGRTQLRNLGRARLLGAEARLRLLRPDWLDSRLEAALLRAQRLDVEAPDRRLECRPAWQLAWSEILRPWGRLELWGRLRVVGPQWFLNDDTLAWGRLGTYLLADASLALLPTPASTLRIRAANLLDADVQARFGYPDPGRELWLELEMRF